MTKDNVFVEISPAKFTWSIVGHSSSFECWLEIGIFQIHDILDRQEHRTGYYLGAPAHDSSPAQVTKSDETSTRFSLVINVFYDISI